MVENERRRDRVLASYAEAVTAFRQLDLSRADWDAPTPCGEWTLLQLSGHVLAIARYWHRLLNAAESGRHLVALPRGIDLAAMNDRDLGSLVDLAGPARVEKFLDFASSYMERLRKTDWALILGDWSGLGPMSVGQHTGVAIGEWHVHAWDMARCVGGDHRPSDAAVVAEGNRAIREVPVGDDPWAEILVVYERDPSWTAVSH